MIARTILVISGAIAPFILIGPLKEEVFVSASDMRAHIPLFLLTEFSRWLESTQLYFFRVLLLTAAFYVILLFMEFFVFVLSYIFAFVAYFVRCGVLSKLTSLQ